jgi:hypothetical protein
MKKGDSKGECEVVRGQKRPKQNQRGGIYLGSHRPGQIGPSFSGVQSQDFWMRKSRDPVGGRNRDDRPEAEDEERRGSWAGARVQEW